jgi:predicted helicase
MLFEPEAGYELRLPNLSAEILNRLSSSYGKTCTPEEIYYYIYAVLYSNIYRTKYAESLKIDFPRVPFASDFRLFKKMAGYGNRLVDLHLLKSKELDLPVAQYPVKGDNRAEKPKYDENTGRIYINKEQYFERISGEAWNYQIGGYQVCDKWLKDRKGRVLSLDEIKTYCKIITAIQKTMVLQEEIDPNYSTIENSLINFNKIGAGYA